MKPWAVATVLGCSVVLLVVQIGSSALYARAASAISLPAHLPVHLGTAIYTRLASIAPFPFVEETLADDALRRHDLIAAATFTARMPAGPRRAQRDARIAAVRGDTNAAIAYDLDAGDDEALQHVITDRERHGRIRDAYDLERRWRDRLATSQTRPNALAASWWRLGRLALRSHDLDEAAFDTAHAIALAPLNTRYLIDGGLIALARNDTVEAAALFARAHDVDPADASAVAGLESAPLVIH